MSEQSPNSYKDKLRIELVINNLQQDFRRTVQVAVSLFSYISLSVPEEPLLVRIRNHILINSGKRVSVERNEDSL